MSFQTCRTCRYFVAATCRYHAPGLGQSGLAWPRVEPDDWCGRWAIASDAIIMKPSKGDDDDGRPRPVPMPTGGYP